MDGYSAENLKKIWRSPEIFAEEILKISVPYFGFNMDDCSLGYQDVKDCYKVWENYLEIKLKYTEDYFLRHPEATLPFLRMFSWNVSIEGSLNKTCTLSFNFVNGGAKSQGFAIILYGEAIETDLISFLEIEIEFYSMDHYVEETISGTFEKATAATTNGESQQVYLCTFPEAFLPKGDWEESPILKVKCSGVLNKLGDAQLFGVIIPRGNQDEGRTRFSTVIQGTN